MRGRARDLLDGLAGMPELIPGLLAVAVFVVLGAADAGFAATTWNPAALFLLGLLAATMFAYRGRLADHSRPLGVAVLLLAAFVLWCFVSISWAGDQGVAWEGADRMLLYFTIFALFALPAWRPRSAAIVLGAFSLGIAVVGMIALLRANGSSTPELFFVSGTFAEPTGYHNANAALFAIAFFPVFFLATRRETPWVLRGPALAVAGVLVELALLPQSRGAAIVFPIAAALYLALVPGRVRGVLTALPLAGVVLLSSDAILDVYPAFREGGLDSAMGRATDAVCWSFLALLVIGLALALADRRLGGAPAAQRVIHRTVGAATAAAVIAAAVIALAAIGNPKTWATDRWDDFKNGLSSEGFSGSRLGGSLGSNRYDFWRVAYDEFTDEPVAGVGIENFQVDYLRERESTEEPLYPHNLPLGIAAQTGLVGLALFGGFLIAALVAAARVRWSAHREFARGLSAATVVTFAYWFMHGTGDWLLELPAVSAPAFACLALAGSIDPVARRAEAGERAPAGTGDWPARVLAGMAVVGGVAAALAIFMPWIAANQVRDAADHWGADPKAAFDELDRARGWNFLSDEPDLVAGVIAVQLDDRARIRESFQNALDRHPEDWYARLELGVLAAVEGDRDAAIRWLRGAQALNPSDELIATVLRRVEDGRPVSFEFVDRTVLGRLCVKVGRTHDTEFCRAGS